MISPDLLATEPTELLGISEKHFEAKWRIPIAVAAAQLDGVVRIRDIMKRLPGLDRGVGLKALDRLVELGALSELPRADDAPKTAQRQFVVNPDHVTWQIYALLAEAEQDRM